MLIYIYLLFIFFNILLPLSKIKKKSVLVCWNEKNRRNMLIICKVVQHTFSTLLAHLAQLRHLGRNPALFSGVCYLCAELINTYTTSYKLFLFFSTKAHSFCRFFERVPSFPFIPLFPVFACITVNYTFDDNGRADC